VGEAVERARRLRRPIVASVTLDVDPALDVAGLVFATRGAEERYFVWEQPDRDGFALGCIGSAWEVGPLPAGDRFRHAGERCADVLRDAVVAGEVGDSGAGPLFAGGFAFAAEGAIDPQWAALGSTQLTLPALSAARHGGEATVTANVVCRPGDDAEDLVRVAASRLDGIRVGPLPLSDPDPLGGLAITSVLAPERYVSAVAAATERIRAGELEKVVLAREVRLDARTPFHPAAVFGALRLGYPSCFSFCVGARDAAFVGASPELLVRRQGASVGTVAMAGSTRRSADPAVDDHLGERLLRSAKDREEHAIVARRIERTLAPLAVWVAAAEEPGLVKVANIQHLATPIRAQLAEPRTAVELAGALHPTPAGGGEPWPRARELIAELESLDRGWYAGAVGWMDAADDGEFCVAIRSALLHGLSAHCYAGVGVVGDSDPESELEETEIKLQAVMPALAGS
jgi:salicylate biosynthesis isochorismate synthase/menaquinone-specific isochorismate synthase